MAKACGIRIGPRRFELFVLDGTGKKPKVITSAAGSLPADPDAAAKALREAVKTYGVPRENVGLVVDTRFAAFRRVQLPFSEPAKIEPVIKFEVESQLPQFNIDDVVVDFQVLDATPENCSLIVTAYPKEELRRAIDLCSAAGFEPLEAETEVTAMVNAALGTGLVGVDEAQVLVHVGEDSCAVAVVDGTSVREMRTIQVGAFTGTRLVEPASGFEDEAGEASDEGETESAARTALEAPDPVEEARRLNEIIGRLRRELARTVSAARTANELTTIHVCGFELPGLCDEDVLGVPVRRMEELLPEASDREDTGSAAVAYGAALRQLGGGVLRPRLRREELKFTGALERLELPLAVFSLLLVTFLGVWNIFLDRDVRALENAVVTWRISSNNFMYGEPTEGQPGILLYPSEKLRDYIQLVRSDDGDPDRTPIEQIQRIRRLLNDEIRDLEKELGRDGEIQQPQSALKALTLVLKVFDDNKETIRRPSIRQVRAVYTPGKGQRGDSVRVTMDVTFFGDDSLEGTRDFEAFQAALRAQPWFVDFRDSKSETLDDGKGIYKAGIAIEVDVSRIPEVQS